MEKVLESREKMEQIADSLVLVAKYCGFEGWLMNIECSVNQDRVGMLMYVTVSKSKHFLKETCVLESLLNI